MSEPYLPCNHPVVERMYFVEDRLTHLHACSAMHVPSSPPSPAIHSQRFSSAAFLDCVLYLQVFFCVTRLLTLLVIDSVRLIRAKFFRAEHCLRWKVRVCFLLVEHTHAGSALWRGRKRCLSGCDLLGFSGVWSAANDNWVNLFKTGDLSPSDCFPRRAILRMLKWWRAQRSERMSSYKLHCGHLLSL